MEGDQLEGISELANLFIANTDKLVKLRQSVVSEATLPPTTAQQILTFKEESEPDALITVNGMIQSQMNQLRLQTEPIQ